MSKQSDLVSVSQGASGDPLYIDTTNDRVGVGTSSPTADGLHIYEASQPDLYLGNANDADGFRITYNSTDTVIGNYSNTPLRIIAGGSEVARVLSNGWFAVTGSGTLPFSSNGVSLSKNGMIYSRCDTDWNMELGGSQANRVRFFSSGGGTSTVGSIVVSTNSTGYNTSSDYRLKENVTPLDGAADRLAQIPVHRFNFIADPDTTVDGFLAHEVQAFVPEAITGEKDGLDADGNPEYQGIDQSKLVPLLTAALQEALQKIDALEARVAALEAV